MNAPRACSESEKRIHAKDLLRRVQDIRLADDKIAYISDLLKREDVLWQEADFAVLVQQLQMIAKKVPNRDDQISFKMLCEKIHGDSRFWKFVAEKVAEIVAGFWQRFSDICSRLWGVDGRPYRA